MCKPEKEKYSFREAWTLNWRGFKQLCHLIPGAVLSNCCWVILEALSPYAGIWLSARIIGELAGARNPQRLTQLVVVTLAATICIALATAAARHWKNAESATAWHSILSLYGDKMMKMDFSMADHPQTHELLNQIQQNANWKGAGLHGIEYDSFIRAIFQIGGGAALTVSLFTQKVPEGPMVFLNHPLSIVALLGIMLAFVLIAPVCSTKSESYWAKGDEELKLGNQLFSFFGFLGMDSSRALDMRLYNQFKTCRRHLASTNSFGSRSLLARWARGPMGLFAAAGAAISAGFTGVAYAFVCMKAWAGAFGIGGITQYVGAITNFSAGITLLVRTIGRIYNNAPFIRTCYEFLDLPNQMRQGSLPVEKGPEQHSIEFRDVSFKYPAAETWALHHVSMKFKVNQRLAVVGQNGSGKTTFIKLLCRLYDPTEGQILLDGIDIREYNYEEYLSIFSVVFQDFQLLAFSLGENVAAKGTYNPVLAEQCLRQVGFGDRLDLMPNGLESRLGRNFDPQGVEVSGGEAQKIAIARALYKNTGLMVLDEPTAALDPAAEQEIYQHFNTLTKDRTTVYISHRLSSCRFCDQILVFDQGSIIQQGTHDQLLAEEDGKYAELWNAQAQYYR